MADYKKNPRRPFEVGCPNGIRKRIAEARRMDRRGDSAVSTGLSYIKSMFMRAMLRDTGMKR
jgi:hypothetical protein